MLNGGLLADEDDWGGSGIHAAADRETAQSTQGNSAQAGGEMIWTHAGHSLSSWAISVFPGPDCAYRFVMSSPTACFSTASLRSMSRVAIFPLPS